MKISQLVKLMAEAGAPPAAIAIAVEALEERDERDAARRERAAEKKRRQRAALALTEGQSDDLSRGQSRDSLGTGEGQVGDSPRPSSPLSPPLPEKEALSPTPPIQEKLTLPPIIPPSPAISAQKPKNFSTEAEEFYREYPKKINPMAAKRKFDAVVRSQKIDPGDILAAVRKFAEAHRMAETDKQFIPAPEVWLNKGGWASEDLPQKRKEKQQLYSNLPC
jgi:hypothetical protein